MQTETLIIYYLAVEARRLAAALRMQRDSVEACLLHMWSLDGRGFYHCNVRPEYISDYAILHDHVHGSGTRPFAWGGAPLKRIAVGPMEAIELIPDPEDNAADRLITVYPTL